MIYILSEFILYSTKYIFVQIFYKVPLTDITLQASLFSLQIIALDILHIFLWTSLFMRNMPAGGFSTNYERVSRNVALLRLILKYQYQSYIINS